MAAAFLLGLLSSAVVSQDPTSRVTVEAGGVVNVFHGGSVRVGNNCAASSGSGSSRLESGTSSPPPAPSHLVYDPSLQISFDSTDIQVSTLFSSKLTGFNLDNHDPGAVTVAPDGNTVHFFNGRTGMTQVDAALGLWENVPIYGIGNFQAKINACPTSPCDGVGLRGGITGPEGMAYHPVLPDTILVVDNYLSKALRLVDLVTKNVTTIATGFMSPKGLAIKDGKAFMSDAYHSRKIQQVNLSSSEVTTAYQFPSSISPAKIAMHPTQNRLFVLTFNQHCILDVNLDASVHSVLAGSCTSPGNIDATGSEARFSYPRGLAMHPNGDILFVADTLNKMIRKVDVSTGSVTHFAGAPYTSFPSGNCMSSYPCPWDGSGNVTNFQEPRDITVSGDGTFLIVVEKELVRRIDLRPQ